MQLHRPIYTKPLLLLPCFLFEITSTRLPIPFANSAFETKARPEQAVLPIWIPVKSNLLTAAGGEDGRIPASVTPAGSHTTASITRVARELHPAVHGEDVSRSASVQHRAGIPAADHCLGKCDKVSDIGIQKKTTQCFVKGKSKV